MAKGLASAHARDYHMHAPSMSPQLQDIFQRGLAVTPDDLAAARAAQRRTRRFFQALFEPPSDPPSLWHPLSDPSTTDLLEDDGAVCEGAGDGVRYHAALSLPVLGAAPPRAEGTGSPRPAALWSLGGAPALAVPWGLTPEGLPLAVQLSAGHGADRQLLRIAAVLHSHAVRMHE